MSVCVGVLYVLLAIHQACMSGRLVKGQMKDASLLGLMDSSINRIKIHHQIIYRILPASIPDQLSYGLTTDIMRSEIIEI